MDIELEAGIRVLWDTLQRCHQLFQFDLRHMIEFGPEYNQAVKDVADAVAGALKEEAPRK